MSLIDSAINLGTGIQNNLENNGRWAYVTKQNDDALAKAREQLGYTQGQYGVTGGRAADYSNGILPGMNAYLYGGDNPYSYQLGDRLSAHSGNFNNSFAQYGSPYMNDMMGDTLGARGAAGSQLDTLGTAFGNIAGQAGASDRSGYGLDRATDFGNGLTGGLMTQTDMANRIFGQNGQSNFGRNAADRATEAMNLGGTTDILNSAALGGYRAIENGGMTDSSKQGMSSALGLLGNSGYNNNLNTLAGAGANELTGNLGVGGLTRTGAQGELAALQGISNGGNTALTGDVSSLGMKLAGQQPLMTGDQASGIARNQAATDMAQQAEAFRRHALLRGGGPGATVANGATNQALAEFADQGSRGVSAAGTAARTTQQQLGLQQQTMGGQLALGGGNLAQNNLQTNSSLLSGLEGVAANRFGTGGGLLGQSDNLANARMNTGLNGVTSIGSMDTNRMLGGTNAMANLQNAANSRANVYSNAALGAESNANSLMGIGAGFLQNYNTNMLGGQQLAGNLLQNQNNYGLGAGNLSNTLQNSVINSGHLTYQDLLGSQQAGINNFNAYNNGQNQGFQNSINFNNTMNTGWNNAQNPLTQLGGQWIGAGNTAMNNLRPQGLTFTPQVQMNTGSSGGLRNEAGGLNW